ncbi:MAG: DUF1850 domain-containing protein [Acidaminobacteraceae bacterium]
MSSSNNKIKLFAVPLTLIIIAIVTLSTYKLDVMEVFVFDKGERFNEIVLQSKANIGDTFDVYWTHSVSRRPVIETYKIEDDYMISIEQMIFDTFSANLPASPDYDTKWEYTKDYIRVYNYDVEFDAVPVVIGKVRADHILIYKDLNVHLKDVYKPGGYVKIRVVNKSYLSYLIEEVRLYVTN